MTLLIQCIRSHPPYLVAVSSIYNLRERHVVVTGAHLIRTKFKTQAALPDTALPKSMDDKPQETLLYGALCYTKLWPASYGLR